MYVQCWILEPRGSMICHGQGQKSNECRVERNTATLIATLWSTGHDLQETWRWESPRTLNEHRLHVYTVHPYVNLWQYNHFPMCGEVWVRMAWYPYWRRLLLYTHHLTFEPVWGRPCCRTHPNAWFLTGPVYTEHYIGPILLKHPNHPHAPWSACKAVNEMQSLSETLHSSWVHAFGGQKNQMYTKIWQISERRYQV